MARLSKYFTPNLQLEDINRISTALGLAQVPLTWIENLAGETVFSQSWNPQTGNTGDNKIIVEPASSSLPPEKAYKGESIFEKLVPFPFSILFSRARPNLLIRLSPVEFESQVEQLSYLSHQLEQELSRFELSALWVHGNGESIPLLFHFVRKKLVRVGTLRALDDLVESYSLRKLAPSDLRQFFGTNAAFFELKVIDFSPLDSPLANLIEALRTTVNDPSHRVLGENLLRLENPEIIELEL